MAKFLSPTLRLQELLRRLGIEGSDYMAITEDITPTLAVGDVSALVPTLAPPASVVGGQIAGGGTASTSASFQLVNRGGASLAFAGAFSWSSSNRAAWDVSPQPGNLTLTSTLQPLDRVIGGPNGNLSAMTDSSFLLGQAPFASMPAAVTPQIRVGSLTLYPVDVLIPPGRVFEITGFTNDSTMAFFAEITQLEVA